jgi:hypothetical protein
LGAGFEWFRPQPLSQIQVGCVGMQVRSGSGKDGQQQQGEERFINEPDMSILIVAAVSFA